MLEKNQILITISENKDKLTITSGGDNVREMSFEICPTKPIEDIGNAIQSFMKSTRLENYPEWRKEECCGQCSNCL